MKRQNSDIFDDEEFGLWSRTGKLDAQEQQMFEKHLFKLPPNTRILDVGTGGGRFLFALYLRGFQRLSGIDTSARMIETAQARFSALAAADCVHFSVQDATRMNFADQSQDVVIALQQLASLIEDPAARLRVFSELARVLLPGGLLIASFLNWDARWYNPLLAGALLPLKILKGELSRLRKNYLCWLRLGNRANFAYLWTKQPYVYWFHGDEIDNLLSMAGLEIVDMHTGGTALYLAARKSL